MHTGSRQAFTGPVRDEGALGNSTRRVHRGVDDPQFSCNVTSLSLGVPLVEQRSGESFIQP
jgi:hypothetical protein